MHDPYNQHVHLPWNYPIYVVNDNISFYLNPRLRNGASYKSADGATALYLNGNGTYAEVPAVNLYELSAFTIMCWVKVLEPAENPGYIFADWSSPQQFSIWVHDGQKAVYFQLKNKFGQNLISIYTG